MQGVGLGLQPSSNPRAAHAWAGCTKFGRGGACPLWLGDELLKVCTMRVGPVAAFAKAGVSRRHWVTTSITKSCSRFIFYAIARAGRVRKRRALVVPQALVCPAGGRHVLGGAGCRQRFHTCRARQIAQGFAAAQLHHLARYGVAGVSLSKRAAAMLLSTSSSHVAPGLRLACSSLSRGHALLVSMRGGCRFCRARTRPHSRR